MPATARAALVAAAAALVGMVVGSMIGLVVARAALADPGAIAGVLWLCNVVGIAVGAVVGVWQARRAGIDDARTAMLAGGGGAFGAAMVLALLGLGSSTFGDLVASILSSGAGASAGAVIGARLTRPAHPTPT
jgi:hypothetical protein